MIPSSPYPTSIPLIAPPALNGAVPLVIIEDRASSIQPLAFPPASIELNQAQIATRSAILSSSFQVLPKHFSPYGNNPKITFELSQLIKYLNEKRINAVNLKPMLVGMAANHVLTGAGYSNPIICYYLDDEQEVERIIKSLKSFIEATITTQHPNCKKYDLSKYDNVDTDIPGISIFEYGLLSIRIAYSSNPLHAYNGFHIPLLENNTKVVCFDGLEWCDPHTLNNAISHLSSRKIAFKKDVANPDLFWDLARNMTFGYANISEFGVSAPDIAFNKLVEQFPLKSQLTASNFANRLAKHLYHNCNHSTPDKIFFFLNLLSMLRISRKSNDSKHTELHNGYVKLFVNAWKVVTPPQLDNTVVGTLDPLVRILDSNPNQLEQVLDIVKGLYFTLWIQNPDTYNAFAFNFDLPNEARLFFCMPVQTRKIYLSLDGSPTHTAIQFLRSWKCLEDLFKTNDELTAYLRKLPEGLCIAHKDLTENTRLETFSSLCTEFGNSNLIHNILNARFNNASTSEFFKQLSDHPQERVVKQPIGTTGQNTVTTLLTNVQSLTHAYGATPFESKHASSQVLEAIRVNTQSASANAPPHVPSRYYDAKHAFAPSAQVPRIQDVNEPHIAQGAYGNVGILQKALTLTPAFSPTAFSLPPPRTTTTSTTVQEIPKVPEPLPAFDNRAEGVSEAPLVHVPQQPKLFIDVRTDLELLDEAIVSTRKILKTLKKTKTLENERLVLKSLDLLVKLPIVEQRKQEVSELCFSFLNYALIEQKSSVLLKACSYVVQFLDQTTLIQQHSADLQALNDKLYEFFIKRKNDADFCKMYLEHGSRLLEYFIQTAPTHEIFKPFNEQLLSIVSCLNEKQLKIDQSLFDRILRSHEAPLIINAFFIKSEDALKNNLIHLMIVDSRAFEALHAFLQYYKNRGTNNYPLSIIVEVFSKIAKHGKIDTLVKVPNETYNLMLYPFLNSIKEMINLSKINSDDLKNYLQLCLHAEQIGLLDWSTYFLRVSIINESVTAWDKNTPDHFAQKIHICLSQIESIAEEIQDKSSELSTERLKDLQKAIASFYVALPSITPAALDQIIDKLDQGANDEYAADLIYHKLKQRPICFDNIMENYVTKFLKHAINKQDGFVCRSACEMAMLALSDLLALVEQSTLDTFIQLAELLIKIPTDKLEKGIDAKFYRELGLDLLVKIFHRQPIFIDVQFKKLLFNGMLESLLAPINLESRKENYNAYANAFDQLQAIKYSGTTFIVEEFKPTISTFISGFLQNVISNDFSIGIDLVSHPHLKSRLKDNDYSSIQGAVTNRCIEHFMDENALYTTQCFIDGLKSWQLIEPDLKAKTAENNRYKSNETYPLVEIFEDQWRNYILFSMILIRRNFLSEFDEFKDKSKVILTEVLLALESTSKHPQDWKTKSADLLSLLITQAIWALDGSNMFSSYAPKLMAKANESGLIKPSDKKDTLEVASFLPSQHPRVITAFYMQEFCNEFLENPAPDDRRASMYVDKTLELLTACIASKDVKILRQAWQALTKIQGRYPGIIFAEDTLRILIDLINFKSKNKPEELEYCKLPISFFQKIEKLNIQLPTEFSNQIFKAAYDSRKLDLCTNFVNNLAISFTPESARFIIKHVLETASKSSDSSLLKFISGLIESVKVNYYTEGLTSTEASQNLLYLSQYIWNICQNLKFDKITEHLAHLHKAWDVHKKYFPIDKDNKSLKEATKILLQLCLKGSIQDHHNITSCLIQSHPSWYPAIQWDLILRVASISEKNKSAKTERKNRLRTILNLCRSSIVNSGVITQALILYCYEDKIENLKNDADEFKSLFAKLFELTFLYGSKIQLENLHVSGSDFFKEEFTCNKPLHSNIASTLMNFIYNLLLETEDSYVKCFGTLQDLVKYNFHSYFLTEVRNLFVKWMIASAEFPRMATFQIPIRYLHTQLFADSKNYKSTEKQAIKEQHLMSLSSHFTNLILFTSIQSEHLKQLLDVIDINAEIDRNTLFYLYKYFINNSLERKLIDEIKKWPPVEELYAKLQGAMTDETRIIFLKFITEIRLLEIKQYINILHNPTENQNKPLIDVIINSSTKILIPSLTYLINLNTIYPSNTNNNLLEKTTKIIVEYLSSIDDVLKELKVDIRAQFWQECSRKLKEANASKWEAFEKQNNIDISKGSFKK